MLIAASSRCYTTAVQSDPEVVVDAIARERLSIADTARRFGLPEGDVSESSTRRPATL
jgi:hypothetical protein